MIHRQLGSSRRINGATSFACAWLFGFLIGNPSGPASAGEFDRSTLPAAVADPAECGSGGERPSLLKDSGDCRRISGYIAAGARSGTDEEIGGRNSPFGPLDAPEFVGAVRAAGAALIAPPADLDRIFAAPSSGYEAR